MTGRLATRWLLLAAISALTVTLLLALAGVPPPLRADPSAVSVDTTTRSRLAPQAAAAAGELRVSATVTETYAAVIGASPLFMPVYEFLFVPVVTR